MNSPDEEPEHSRYGYQGHLVFQPFRTTVKEELDQDNRQQTWKNILDRLPEQVEQPEEKNENEGYAPICELTPELDGSSADSGLSENILSINYKIRWLKEKMALVEDEMKSVPVVETESADLILSYPDFLFARGNTFVRERAINTFRRLLADRVLIEKFKFSHDFFLWLLWRYYENKSLSSGEISRVSGVDLEGEDDLLGASNRTTGSEDAIRSPSVIAGLLRGKRVTRVELIYQMNDSPIRVDIEKNRVNIKASSDSLQDKSDLTRMRMSIRFLVALCDQYLSWQEMDPRDRYPPQEFFEQLYRTGLEAGVEIDGISTEVLNRYSSLRGESE